MHRHRRAQLLSCCEQVEPPEECEQLLSTAGGPGQIHTVINAVRSHHESTAATAVSTPSWLIPKLGERNVKASVLCNYTAPVFSTHSTQLCNPSDLLIPIRDPELWDQSHCRFPPTSYNGDVIIAVEPGLSSSRQTRSTKDILPLFLCVY
ncbi:hypothetical protein NQD34_007061 [Periophthalmus magnuspinnatus]|nr:hypothetical protein NQD34_007061 [Periophthalmus magnuspinnatus]